MRTDNQGPEHNLRKRGVTDSVGPICKTTTGKSDKLFFVIGGLASIALGLYFGGNDGNVMMLIGLLWLVLSAIPDKPWLTPEDWEERGLVLSASLIASVGVAIGFADLPYGYYMLLRLYLCGTSLFFVFGAKLVMEPWQIWSLLGFAVLYNPLLPIYLRDKGLWEIANVVTVILFWTVSVRRKL